LETKFTLAPDGTVIMMPVTEWTIHSVAGVAILAVIHYNETPADVAPKTIQLVLSAPKALELADQLRKASIRVLESPPPPGTVLH
jgi:hypothetical protein